ncbi:MAG: TRAP transporter small permease subunit [Alphaproteobacteria bacterium]|nr:TRAP transporter small permease subunit [Rhodospirillales bacterium]MCW9044908.1 TRAP transporter small permease subunit [Alphaproteobacteria bacterium]
MPFLLAVSSFIDQLNDKIGRFVSWFALLMVSIQFIVVVMRYVFGIGSIMMQESIIYMHAIIFLVGAGYTLLNDGHVRVDIFYREARPQRKAMVDLFGVTFFMIPVCVLILWFTWPYVSASWAVQEGSKETSGIQAVFLLKSLIIVFSGLMILQALSIAAKCIMTLILPSSTEKEGEG